MTLLLVFPKHAESEHRPKPLRCGHKPPEETALTGTALRRRTALILDGAFHCARNS